MTQHFIDTVPFSPTHTDKSCSLLKRYEAFYPLAEITEHCGEKHMIFLQYKIMAEPPDSSVFASLLPPVGNASYPKIIKHQTKLSTRRFKQAKSKNKRQVTRE